LAFFNYSKPGPGVSKDEPQKKRIVIFFEVLQRKFFDLVKLNLLFMVPVVAVVFLIYLLNLWGTHGPEFLQYQVSMLPVILLFPCIGGMTYVTRNYAREEHAFILSDFIDAIKNNWKAFLIHGLISYVFLVVVSFSLEFYRLQIAANSFFVVPFTLCICVTFIFLAMQYYIPVMIVTLDLNLRKIYRNAVSLVFVALLRNFLLTLFLVALFVLGFILSLIHIIGLLVVLLLLVLFVFSFISFVINFTVYPVIDRYIIQPFYEKQAQEEQVRKAREQAQISGASLGRQNQEEKSAAVEPKKSEYVYKNGKLVKKSEEDSIFEDRI
jgi:uncharacterized membrane protein YesL